MTPRHLLAGLAVLALAACSHSAPPPAATAMSQGGIGTGPAASVAPPTGAKPVPTIFVPPPESAIPRGPFGDMVRLGREIFVDTGVAAKAYVGNGLRCSNCHLDAGRLANSAPLWGAYVAYPAYRAKNGHVNTLGERLQGCFKYSMNGKAPPLDAKEMVALETYAFWMAKGAPTGEKLPGAGYPKKGFKPPQPPDFARGEAVFKTHCALCHGADGQGQQVAGRYVFPPLWGPDSFNWGAGMGQLDNAAAFIKANMPLSQGGSLTDQDAWDVAMYMDAHERPQDPRFKGDLAATRKAYHDTPMSLYGTTVNGHLLGSAPAMRK
ncbi:MAG: c-type cytochrome [Xanthomonadaceae bacterium]|nr:c-type cytochrome [Xanthomonadaceae bacterium]MDE1963743.1 c-type cytochrome [Xanthomonadaceae bacterium]